MRSSVARNSAFFIKHWQSSSSGRFLHWSISAGEPPPIEAYGAVLKAYGRIKDADSAMHLFKEFQDSGGEPDDRLVDDAVTACIRAKQFRRALQVRSQKLSFCLLLCSLRLSR